MIRILRVEKLDGTGCFNSSIGNGESLWFHGLYNHDSYIFPNAEEDEIENWKGKLFGCPCACSFFHWFGEIIENLNGKFLIKSYLIRYYDIGKSKTQVVFSKENIISYEIIKLNS